MPTPPPPAPGAEVDTFTINNAAVDANGEVVVDIDSFADKDNANDVTITNTATDDITLITVTKLGDNEGEEDVIRFDLSEFDDNFAIVLENTGDTVQDQLILEGVHRYTDNGDGTFSVSYYGSDDELHFIQVTPDEAALDIYYAPDGIFDGTEGADTIDVDDEDFQGDIVDGADGDDDAITGYGGTDSINGGDGADTIFGDYDTFDGLLTPGLPPNAYTGTPAGPAGGAEVDTVTLNNTIIDANGEAVITIDDFADKNNANDVTVNDGGTDDLNLLIIEKGGDGDGEADVFRLDLSGYDDDFDIELKNTDEFDKLVLTNVHTIDENGDGTWKVTYYGSDSQLHTIGSITLDVAGIEAYVTGDSPYFFDDTIDGGAGDDVIDGGFGDDTITGGADNDYIIGGLGLDTLDGGTGNDSIFGDWDAPLTPEAAPGTPDTLVDGTDWTPSAGVWNADISSVEDPAVANHIKFSDNGTFVGVTEIKISGQDDAGEEDILHFDLSTFNDDFFINFRSQSDPEDKLYLEGVYSSQVDEITGIWTVTYYGADEALHTVTVNPGAASVETFFGPPPDSVFYDEHDSITGGAGDDSIDGGFGDDTIDAGADDDSVDGGLGDDQITGGTGADTIYGGDGLNPIPLERIAFEWSNVPDPDDGGQIDNNDALEDGFQVINGVEVDYTFSSANASFGTETTAISGVDAGSGSVDPNSVISFDDDVTVDLNFSQPVTNVSFRISDLEVNSEVFTLRAYDIDGNLITFTATPGTNVNGSDTDAASGDDTFQGPGSEQGDTSLANSVLFEIPGPVARIEMIMTSPGGGSLTGTDIWFDDPDTGVDEIGNDSIDAGGGDDVILAGRGDDTIIGGTGTDTYDANTSADLVDETITVTVDGNGNGSATKLLDGTTDILSGIESFIAGEDENEADEITFTAPVTRFDVSGMDNSAVGFFTSDDTGLSYFFGGSGEPTINDILTRSYDPGTGILRPQGTYTITGGEENGAQIGTFYVENFENINFDVVCFARGTRILTDRGEVEIEDLRAGDMVETLDDGLQPIRWIGSTTTAALGKNAPVEIRKSALGNSRDLRVSPQHRMLLTGWQLELLFGDGEALVPAKNLINDHSIRRVQGGIVEYFHMLFDSHQIVFAEGAPSESFHPGAVGMATFDGETLDEIHGLFPHIREDVDAYGPAARLSLKAYEAKVLNNMGGLIN